MFYPPEGLCGAEPEGGAIVFTFHFIGVGKGKHISRVQQRHIYLTYNNFARLPRNTILETYQ